jgi:hypothetical protein
MRFSRHWRKLLATLALAAGCAVDVPRLMTQDADLQARVMEVVANDSTLARRMVERLLAGDSTRPLVVEGVLQEGESARLAMLAIARDRTRLDGVLSLAVQDTAMKGHVLTLFRGMQMAGAR